jgi:hypothetical protein
MEQETVELWTPSMPTVSKTKKSVQRIGDRLERTSANRTEKRKNQAIEVLKAFIASDSGFTDQELVAGVIGGADGPRRRRYLRSAWGLSFNVRIDATGLKRYSLASKEHARETLKAGGKIDDPL